MRIETTFLGVSSGVCHVPMLKHRISRQIGHAENYRRTVLDSSGAAGSRAQRSQIQRG